jgi:histidinol-phosphate aminotransferase
VDAVHAGFDASNRYPFATVSEVTALIAKSYGVKPENVLLGTGSTQVLRTAVQVFTAPDRPLVEPLSTFETPHSYANFIKSPVKTVALRPNMTFDLDGLVDAAKTNHAGVLFYNNPNNPIGNAVDGKTTRDFIAAVRKASPDTTLLVDEAYAHYATMAGYETMIPIAVADPKVIVTRTFSKIYGMAGLRLGYVIGHPDTIKLMSAWDGTGTVNVLALAAARAGLTMDPAILKSERERNTAVRAFTTKWFADRGHTSTDSQANFIFVDVKQPTKQFRDACAKEGVRVGRDFPPYATYCRITIGTMDEMQKAVQVFEKVLAETAKAA